MAMRGWSFPGPAYGTLAEGTIRGAVLYVAQTFWDNARPNPIKDKDWKLGNLLSLLYKAFKNEDPNTVHQKPLPACVLREVAKKMSTETQKATCQLSIGAFSFASKFPKLRSKGLMFCDSETSDSLGMVRKLVTIIHGWNVQIASLYLWMVEKGWENRHCHSNGVKGYHFLSCKTVGRNCKKNLGIRWSYIGHPSISSVEIW